MADIHNKLGIRSANNNLGVRQAAKQPLSRGEQFKRNFIRSSRMFVKGAGFVVQKSGQALQAIENEGKQNRKNNWRF